MMDDDVFVARNNVPNLQAHIMRGNDTPAQLR